MSFTSLFVALKRFSGMHSKKSLLVFSACVLVACFVSTAPAKSSKSSSKQSKRSSVKVGQVEMGRASWYTGYKKTASGYFNPKSMTAAHKTLPFGTIVRAKNKNNGKYVDVRIDNRGPFIKGRILDLTPAAFKKIAHIDTGVVPIEMTIISVPDKPVRPKW